MSIAQVQSRLFQIFWVALLGCASVFAQLPSITAGGVVSAASWSSPIAPGEMIAIFGTNFAANPVSATPPYPPELGGISVTVNGIAAPVQFVSPTQINALVPASVTATASLLNTARVVVTTAEGSSGGELDVITTGAPGFFTADASGCGQSAALNIRSDGSTSVNSTLNSAAPGDYLALFGTGFGLAQQQPADGAAATPSLLRTPPSVILDGNPVTAVSYFGLAPTLAGVDQINFQIPMSTRSGCSVPVSASQSLGSPSVTISIDPARGKCTDPPTQSWGQVFLFSNSSTGTAAATGDYFVASFPSGPNAKPAAQETIIYAPGWIGGVAQTGLTLLASALPLNVRACQVPGYSYLSAGDVQIQPPSGSAVTSQPYSMPSGGVGYSTGLPAGFVRAGTYGISGSTGSSVGLNTSVTVGSPILVTSKFDPGTVISSSQPLTVNWTGGDAGSLVRVALISTLPAGGGGYSYTYADATSGTLTIRPACQGHGGVETPVTCSFGLANSSNVQISIQVMPNPASLPMVSLPGITGPVQVSWRYNYSFTGLTLGP